MAPPQGVYAVWSVLTKEWPAQNLTETKVMHESVESSPPGDGERQGGTMGRGGLGGRMGEVRTQFSAKCHVLYRPAEIGSDRALCTILTTRHVATCTNHIGQWQRLLQDRVRIDLLAKLQLSLLISFNLSFAGNSDPSLYVVDGAAHIVDALK